MTKKIKRILILVFLGGLFCWYNINEENRKKLYEQMREYQEKEKNGAVPSFGSSNYGYSVSYCEGDNHNCECKYFDKNYQNFNKCKHCDHPENYHHK